MSGITVPVPNEVYIPLPPDTFLAGFLAFYFLLGFVAVFDAYYHQEYYEDSWDPLLPFAIFFIKPIFLLLGIILFGLPGVWEEGS